MSWVQLARDGREMRKAQGRTLAQICLLYTSDAADE